MAATAFGENEDVFERVIDPPVPLSTTWFRLEILSPVHNERDHEAWMSSIEHIHATAEFAQPDWAGDDWPTPMMSDQNLADLEQLGVSSSPVRRSRTACWTAMT